MIGNLKNTVRAAIKTIPPGQRGFTLVELLVVVAIIGVVAAIAVPAMSSALRKANVNAVAGEGKHIYQAFTTFYLDNNS